MKQERKGRFRRWFRRLAGLLLIAVLVAISLICYAYFSASWASRGRLFTDVLDLPTMKVGMVFGTTDRVSGRENLYFRYRMDAAVRVWKSGKIKTLIVSGDYDTDRYYNEPEKMKLALIERGIPANRIVCDPKGLRTLDSVVRAKENFGTTSILMISQKFQNERAIYLAKANGMDAYGFNSQDVETQAGMKTRIREVGARVKMWLDVNILKTRPIYEGGEKIVMPK